MACAPAAEKGFTAPPHRRGAEPDVVEESRHGDADCARCATEARSNRRREHGPPLGKARCGAPCFSAGRPCRSTQPLPQREEAPVDRSTPRFELFELLPGLGRPLAGEQHRFAETGDVLPGARHVVEGDRRRPLGCRRIEQAAVEQRHAGIAHEPVDEERAGSVLVDGSPRRTGPDLPQRSQHERMALCSAENRVVHAVAFVVRGEEVDALEEAIDRVEALEIRVQVDAAEQAQQLEPQHVRPFGRNSEPLVDLGAQPGREIVLGPQPVLPVRMMRPPALCVGRELSR